LERKKTKSRRLGLVHSEVGVVNILEEAGVKDGAFPLAGRVSYSDFSKNKYHDKFL
jgi:hypothetical protein